MLLKEHDIIDVKRADPVTRKTALHYLAGKENYRAVAKSLIQRGADVNAEDIDHKDPFDYAYEQNKDYMASLFVQYMNNKE